MGLIRNPANNANTINYIGTLALFCAVSCMILMIKFKWFKSSFNLNSAKTNSYYEKGPEVVSVTGAYRVRRSEFFDFAESSKRPTPSMVHHPSSTNHEHVRPSKSTSNLLINSANNLPVNLRKSTPDVSVDPHGSTAKYRNSADIHRNSKRISKENRNHEKEQKLAEQKKKDSQQESEKIEKKRLSENKKRDENQRLLERKKKEAEEQQKKLEKKRVAEQKKREKLEAQERTRLDKLKKEREIQEAKQREKETKNKKGKQVKGPAPQPLRPTPIAQAEAEFSTNTLESSISKSSGPPPYSKEPNVNATKNWSDNTGNTSFSDPVDNAGASWDLISQHREQLSRPLNTTGGAKPKQIVMDLKFNFGGSSADNDNSEA